MKIILKLIKLFFLFIFDVNFLRSEEQSVVFLNIVIHISNYFKL